LIDRCKRDVYRQFGVRLHEEIVSMGFERPAADAPGGTEG
jgi:hypothetical protein